MNVIFGASGHAKEIEFLLRTGSCLKNKVVDFLIFDTQSIDTQSENSKNISTITEAVFCHKIEAAPKAVSAYLGIGNGKIRAKIAFKFAGYSFVSYPNLIADTVLGDFPNIKLGVGNIFFPAVLMTTDIIVGNHNHFNLNTSISHDCTIGDYNTFSPGVRIAGNVTVGNHNFFGIGACVIEKVVIGDNVIVGAGAVVTTNLTLAGTYVGVPAKKIK